MIRTTFPATFIIASLIAVVIAPSALAQTNLPTLEEALELSRKSGVPILAMAGRKT